MNSTSNWAWQLEVIQVSSKDVFTKFGCIPHDLNEQIASR